jgi:Zn-finger nucleic acid-binding protein
MRCPIDGSELNISDRQGIEIDFCPKCRGVWLDRGELDKILERSAQFIAPTAEPTATQPRRPDYDDDYSRQPSSGYHKKRRKNMLEELFDFG